MSSAERHNSLTSSRDAKWDARINEFLDNPVFGIGFATQTHYTPDDDEAWIKTTGNIEPGSSWLALLAMTGIIGFILIAIINYRILHTLYLYRAKPIDILLFTLIIFFILHGIIEGWIIFAGGYIFYLYWLLLGMCFTEIRSQSDQNNLLKL